MRDLFPDADLVPVTERSADGARTLATVPARFEPGPAKAASLPLLTPTRSILALAWLAVLAAAGGTALVLRSALALGERRGRFASAVTHELRTPLTTFRMYAQMLSEGMTPAGAEKEYLATMEREADRLSRVVESVLLYARLEEGAAEARRETVEAGALLDRVLPVLERRAAEAGLELEAARDLPAGITLPTDPQAVEQVLFNLVDNACKYAPGGRRIDLEARAEGGRLSITVADRGPGIPRGDRQQVFEDFRRLDRDAAGSVPGVGLGLSVARALARALGGDLVVEDRPGGGAAFRLTLPADS